MAPKIHTTRKRIKDNPLVYEVVRTQRKRISRYKLKKQAGIAEQILDDLFVMRV